MLLNIAHYPFILIVVHILSVIVVVDIIIVFSCRVFVRSYTFTIHSIVVVC